MDNSGSDCWGTIAMGFQSSFQISMAFTHIRKGVARLTTRYKPRLARTESPYGLLGGRTADEQRRRASLIEDFCHGYGAKPAHNSAEAAWAPTPPPDWWINERLEARGESWRVQNIDGYRYEVYDFGAPYEGRAPAPDAQIHPG